MAGTEDRFADAQEPVARPAGEGQMPTGTNELFTKPRRPGLLGRLWAYATGGTVSPPTRPMDATFSYWVRWANNSRFGFLTVLHVMGGLPGGTGTVWVRIKRPGQLPLEEPTRLWCWPATDYSGARADVAVLELAGDRVSANDFLRDKFIGTPVRPAVHPSSLTAQPNVRAVHHLADGVADINIDWFSTAWFPSPEFPFLTGPIPASTLEYRYTGITGVLGGRSNQDGEFGEGRSGSAWVLDGQPLAMQIGGFTGSRFQHGYGQLVHNQLEAIRADSRQTHRFPDIQVVWF